MCHSVLRPHILPRSWHRPRGPCCLGKAGAPESWRSGSSACTEGQGQLASFCGLSRCCRISHGRLRPHLPLLLSHPFHRHSPAPQSARSCSLSPLFFTAFPPRLIPPWRQLPGALSRPYDLGHPTDLGKSFPPWVSVSPPENKGIVLDDV